MSKKLERMSMAAIILTMILCTAISVVYGNKDAVYRGELYIESKLIEGENTRIFMPVAYGLSKKQNAKINSVLREHAQADLLLETAAEGRGNANLRFECETLGNVRHISMISTVKNGKESVQGRSELYFDMYSGKQYVLDNIFPLLSRRSGKNEVLKQIRSQLSVDEISHCFKIYGDHMIFIYPKKDGSGFASARVDYAGIERFIDTDSPFIKALSGAEGNK